MNVASGRQRRIQQLRNASFPPRKRCDDAGVDTLQSMKIFVRVAQLPGFAAAARDLRMSPAAVTKHVAALEARVGARLFDRTTRNVGLTEAGRVYLERCLECLQSFEDADASVSQLSNAPKGLLRVTAPIDVQSFVASVVADFIKAYPDVTVELRLSNRPVDLVEDGVDVAVRFAAALDGQFVARPLATLHLVLVAAPAYVEKHGGVRRPQDIESHRGIVFSEPRPREEWTFVRNGKQVKARLRPVMMTNGGDAIRSALVAGVGITVAPTFLVHEELAAGRLVRLLPDWDVVPEPKLFAVYPHRRFVSAKVRAFVETLRAKFGDGTRDPWWPADA